MPHSTLYIPFEIVHEILLRLDVKTLLTCTSVCKRWDCLIKSPEFISRHSNRALRSKNRTLLFQICCRDSHLQFREIYSLRSDNDQADLLGELESPPISRFKRPWSFFRVVGSCNGLVCLVDNPFNIITIILWNPSLRKYALLPKPDFPLAQEPLGFGFDRRNNDFKVVKLRVVVDIRRERDMAWVCSLATSSWKSVADTPPPCSVLEGVTHVFINGVLHWLARHRTRHYKFVLTLDLADEGFGEILLPPNISEDNASWGSISLVARGDSLAVSQTRLGEGAASSIWCVWVMKEYGVADSWTKIVAMQEQIPKNVFAIRKNEVMILQIKGKIHRYNTTTATMEDLGVCGGDIIFIGNHAESLFLLKKIKGVRSYSY